MKKVKFIITDGQRRLDFYDIRPQKEASFLKEQGFDVEAIILQNKIQGKKIVNNKIDNIRATHYICRSKFIDKALKTPVVKILFFPFYIYLFFSFAIWLRQYLKNNFSEYLCCHNLISMLAGFFAKPKETKLVFVMREIYEGQTTNRFKSSILKKLSKWMTHESYANVYVVPRQYELMDEIGRSKSYYIPNYPSKEIFMPIEKNQHKKINIAYIGNARDYNSLKMLVEQSSGLDNIEVYIHGEYTDIKNELLLLKEKFPHFHLSGYYNFQNDSGELYRDTDVLYCVYNPNKENWKYAYPIKFFEALVTKTPIIMHEQMAPSEYVYSNDIGWIFSYQKPEELREIFLEISNNQDVIKHKSKNFGIVKQEVSWEKIVTEYNKIYI